LQDHNLHTDQKLIVPGGYRFEDGRRAAKELFGLQDPPTAIFAYNDLMAIGAMRAAKDIGLQIPQELSLVGFDDIPGAAYAFPPLTSVRQPKFEMGRCSAELLIEMINGRVTREETQITMGIELILRESTGPAP
jgi:DNA-binding LacI/PurR family transcriptional regulator